MLIVTLPPEFLEDNIRYIIEHPLVGGVRYNIGSLRSCSPREALIKISEITKKENKKLYVDIKGRQLRVIANAKPMYADILLNHNVKVDLPAKIFFRGEPFPRDIVKIDGNKIYVEPLPSIVGAGQAVNIIGNNLEIEGYFTSDDQEHLKICAELGILDIMISFVEKAKDIFDIWKICPDFRPILKIESIPGLQFLSTASQDILTKCQLMAARDDLLQNLEYNNMKMLQTMERIIRIDHEAIMASYIFNSLSHNHTVSLSDVADIRLAQIFGYRHFMFSDSISHYRFDQAIKAWSDYIRYFPFRR